MKIKKLLLTILTWLPSLIITVFFIPNALGKIFQSNELNKVINNNAVIITVGLILLIGVVLFLIDKTIIWGTSILAIYMTFIVFIHMFKGKPYEIVILIVMSTIFAAYLRKPDLFHQKLKE